MVSKEWENPANWLCGIIPGPNTSVIISSGDVIVHWNIIVQSFQLQPGAYITVSDGYNEFLATNQIEPVER